jgi:transcriptional regulator with XRE-family HTH domain
VAKISYEGFKSRDDFEELRNYLLKHIPNVLRPIQQLAPTQQALANEIGVSKATMTYWLKGDRKPTLEHLGKLVAAIERRVTAMVANLETAKDELEALREVQERLQRGEPPPRRKRKGK